MSVRVTRILRGLFFISLLSLTHCGYKELPGLKEKAEGSFKEVLIQYRMRADLVPHFLKLVEGQKLTSDKAELIEGLKRAHGNALGVDLPVEKFDQKQMYRMQSFQYALSAELHKMMQAFDQDSKLSGNPEYQSLKEQLKRLEAQIAAARQRFMSDGPVYNQRLKKTPEKWFNAWLYKFQPIPELENTAAN